MSGYKALIVGVAIVLGFLLSTEATGALAPDVEWNKTFGGSDFDVAKSVQQTSDRGYIVAGYTVSYGAGSADVWILKLDSYGNLKWNKTFGGSDLDWANSVQQTSDGGYIVAGWTESYGTDFGDVWVLKLKAETSGREKPSEYKEEKPSQKMEPTAPSEENKSRRLSRRRKLSL